MFVIDLTDAFAVCNMNTYGLLVKLESKLHFLLSFVKMKLGLMKGTGFRLWGPSFSVYPGNRCCTSQAEAVEVLKISKVLTLPVCTSPSWPNQGTNRKA